MSKAKMQAARELIDEKRYSEAKTILETVDHPIAKKWIAQIDEITSEKPKKPPKKRTSPSVMLLMVFGCFLIVYLASMGQKDTNTTSREIVPTVATKVPAIQQDQVEITSTFTDTPTLEVTSTDDLPATENAILEITVAAGLTQVAINNSVALTMNAPTYTPVLKPTEIPFEASEYERELSNGIFILAGGRNVQSIRVADGRDNGRDKGGERAAIISYLTTETNEVGYVEEIIDIYRAVASTIEARDLDLDAILLIAGTPTGMAAGAVTTQVDTLLDFYNGRISRQQFIGNLETVSF